MTHAMGASATADLANNVPKSTKTDKMSAFWPFVCSSYDIITKNNPIFALPRW